MTKGAKTVRISVRALTNSAAIVSGLLVFLVGIVNMVWDGYGQVFLDILDSVYPGYHATGSFGSVALATFYSVVGGAICGAVLGWVYNGLVAVDGDE